MLTHHDAPLSRFSTLRVGGVAKLLLMPENPEDLAAFMATREDTAGPPQVLGRGSNTLVAGGVIPEPVVLMTHFDAHVVADPVAGTIVAGAGASLPSIAEHAAAAGIGGLEYLSVIPGLLGGGVLMNCGVGGSSGPSIIQNLVRITYVDLYGSITSIAADALQTSYRSNVLPTDGIVVGAVLQGQPGSESDEIRRSIRSLRQSRSSRHPRTRRTSGSVWLPVDGRSAGEFLDELGLRGFDSGAVRLSEVHANWIITQPPCTSEAVEAFIEFIESTVLERSGVRLTRELRLLPRLVGSSNVRHHDG